MLPRGLMNSPSIFGDVLTKDLRDVQLKSAVPLQYVDNILIASSTYKDCFLNTVTVLNHLAKGGYKVSPHKAQICKEEVGIPGISTEAGYVELHGREKTSHCFVKNPRQPKAASWVLRTYRILSNLDSKFWTHSKTPVQFLKRTGL